MTFVTQAIATKYLPATNNRGARIKATAWAGSVTVPYDYALDVDRNHKAAADALIAKMGWTGTFAQGGNVTGTGYYFVNVEGATSDLLAALREVLSLCDRDSDIGRVVITAINKAKG